MVRAAWLLLLVPELALAAPKALVLRDSVYFWSAGCPNPSGGATEQELVDQGVAYDSVSPAAFATANVYDYTMIFLADCQTDASYNAWNARLADLDAWVDDGGFLAVHATRNCSSNTVQPDIPGGTPTQVDSTVPSGTVLQPAHPILAGLPNPATGNSLAHDAYNATGNPADLELIEDPATGRTLLFERPWGAGTIIYGGLTYECYQVTCGSCGGGDAGRVLANEVAHGSTFELCGVADLDLDGVGDDCDVCPAVSDPDQLDGDGDGFGDACDICPSGPDDVDGDGDLVPDACDICPAGDDALDADGDAVPDACDVCAAGDDGADADADGIADACDICPSAPDPQQQDADADGAGTACDCDDADPDVSPIATERCNGVDDDCDGTIDGPGAADASAWYADADADGFGEGAPVVDCAAPTGHAAEGGDCDDADAAVHPGAEETCNGIDDDCDGEIDPACTGADGEAAGIPGEYVEFGCSCSSGAVGGGWLALLLLPILWIRSRTRDPLAESVSAARRR